VVYEVSEIKHYWFTLEGSSRGLEGEFHSTFDPCALPKPEGYNSLTASRRIAATDNPAPELVGTNQEQIGDATSAPLQVPSSSINVDSTIAQLLRQNRTRKSMSRRNQSGCLIKRGKWWKVRFRLDQPGIEKRKLVSVKVAHVSERLTRPQLQVRAKEILNREGANSQERFNRIVLNEGLTFREQGKIYLQEATSRNRRPIQDATSIIGALNKWILPTIGDLPLSAVDNLSLKPLVKKMVAAGLSPRTCEKYCLYAKQIVDSKLAPNGEPLYPRKWNNDVIDLPVVVYSKQKRPALKVDGINALIAAAESDEERYLYVLLAATGMRISEALALESRHFINGGRTIVVEQQVEKDCPRVKMKLKTDASWREVDLHPDVAAYLMRFISGKSGLVLKTENNTPFLYGNLQDDWFDPRLEKLGLYRPGGGWHQFKRFRNSWLRAPAQRCQEDLRKYWLAHKPKEMGEVYSALKEDLPSRLAEAQRVGFGFSLPAEVVPNVPPRRLKVVGRKKPQRGIISIGWKREGV
jgi:integrase